MQGPSGRIRAKAADRIPAPWWWRRPSLPRWRGQALTEFAFLLPVFLLLFAGTLDLGRAFYAQISLTNAAREGAFQAADTPDSFHAGQPCDTTTNVVMCRVLLEAEGSFVSVSPGDVSMSCAPADCTRAVGNTVTVSVHGSLVLLTPLMSAFFGGQSLGISSSATAQLDVVTATPSPTPTATPTATATATASATATATATATASPSPTPSCVHPPNVINMTPAEASALISSAGFTAVAYGDLTKGTKNRVQEQNPDSTQCVGTTTPPPTVCAPNQAGCISYHYRPN